MSGSSLSGSIYIKYYSGSYFLFFGDTYFCRSHFLLKGFKYILHFKFTSAIIYMILGFGGIISGCQWIISLSWLFSYVCNKKKTLQILFSRPSTMSHVQRPSMNKSALHAKSKPKSVKSFVENRRHCCARKKRNDARSWRRRFVRVKFTRRR